MAEGSLPSDHYMKERMIEITCPHCGHVFHIKRDTFCIAGMNDACDKHLQDGTYFTHQCSRCKNLFYMTYPFLYRDPKKKYNLILSSKKDIDNLPKDEQVVVCRDVHQFLFAYKVLSSGLHLKTMISLKKKWEKRYSHAVFESFDVKNRCIWLENEGKLIAIKLKDEDIEKLHS